MDWEEAVTVGCEIKEPCGAEDVLRWICPGFNKDTVTILAYHLRSRGAAYSANFNIILASLRFLLSCPCPVSMFTVGLSPVFRSVIQILPPKEIGKIAFKP